MTKKTKKTYKPGEISQGSVPLSRAGSAGGGTRATDVMVKNLSKPNSYTHKTFNQLPQLIEGFKLEELHDEDSSI